MIDAIGNWAFTIFAGICGLAGSAALVYGLALFLLLLGLGMLVAAFMLIRWVWF